MAISKQDVLEAISAMTVLELSELIKEMEDKFGVSAAAPVAVAAVASGDSKETAEEKTEFDVVLSTVGDNKIGVIKVIREITGLPLKEAKELVESAPKPIKEGVAKADAEVMKKKVEESGATVTLK